MTFLQFTKDELTPDNLASLQSLVEEKKDPTGIISQIIKKFEKALVSTNSSIDFNLYNNDSNDNIEGAIDIQHDVGMTLHFEGHGDYYHQGNRGPTISIENYNDEVLVCVYGDINKEEPTHKISLVDARLEKQLADNDGH